MRTLKLLTAIAACAVSLWAQIPRERLETPQEQPAAPRVWSHPFQQAVYYGAGVQLGWLSGIGLSFRLSTPERWGGELNFGVLKLQKMSFWCLGGELQYRLGISPSYRIYLLAGLGYYSHTTDEKSEPIWPVRFGLGLGFETFPVEMLALGAELAVTAYTNGDDVQILPMPQFGLMYYFR